MSFSSYSVSKSARENAAAFDGMFLAWYCCSVPPVLDAAHIGIGRAFPQMHWYLKHFLVGPYGIAEDNDCLVRLWERANGV